MAAANAGSSPEGCEGGSCCFPSHLRRPPAGHPNTPGMCETFSLFYFGCFPM